MKIFENNQQISPQFKKGVIHVAEETKEKTKKPFITVNWTGVLNPILSLFDRNVRGWLRELGQTIPEDSRWRRESIERGFDVTRGLIEQNIHFSNPTAEFLKEKVTDYGDYFATQLYGKGGGRENANTRLPSWTKDFLAEAEERLLRAEDRDAEFERLKNEFEAKLQAEKRADELRELVQSERAAREPIEWKKQMKRRLYGTEENPGPLTKLATATKNDRKRQLKKRRELKRRLREEQAK